MIVIAQSLLTGKINEREIDVTVELIETWLRSGRPIQQVLPGLSKEDREFLLSGSTPEEWAELISGEEGDDDDSIPVNK